MQRRTVDIRPFIRSFIDTAPLLFLLGILLFIRLPKRMYAPLAAICLTCAFIVAGGFEWVRETARRPWLVYGYMYSNGITVEEGRNLNEQGLLQRSGWARLAVLHAMGQESGRASATRDASASAGGLAAQNAAAGQANATQKNESSDSRTLPRPVPDIQAYLAQMVRDDPAPENAQPRAAEQKQPPFSVAALSPGAQEAYARHIFVRQCSSCHGLGGPMLDIIPRVRGKNEFALRALLTGQSFISPYMPPFFGTREEKTLLAGWLARLAPAADVQDVVKNSQSVNRNNEPADQPAPAQEGL